MFQVVLPSGEEASMPLEDLLGQSRYTVLYFYPKDNTPGCTVQAMDFSAMVVDFAGLGVQVIGVSKDSVASHCRFVEKQGLGIALVADTDLVLHERFATMGEKKMYGKVYQGTIRSTFLLDSAGGIVQERRGVKAKGHAQLVFDYMEAMNS